MAVARCRLDARVLAAGLAPSREKAAALILAGEVLVDGQQVTKAGARVAEDAPVALKGEGLRYVGRGGLKLEAALQGFGLDVAGLVCADLGASTGGFTDCLLQRGAARVYAVDVGYGQLAWKLRQDSRVINMERTNARELQSLPEPIDVVTGDLSFISLRLILPAIARLGRPGGQSLLLIKPQFEAGRAGVGRGGRVRSDEIRAEAIEEVLEAATLAGFALRGRMASPVPGARSGNVEELVWLGHPCAA
jgi:23S rRNA (cytidine1920-2'-O)/16S rRNA (cytidine1409-2'-O)-methyltransferase